MITRVVAPLLLWSALSAHAALLFPTNSTWSFLRGTNEASFPDTHAWTVSNRVNSAFVEASAPFYYGGPTRVGGTLLGDMQSRYSCFFLRKGFVVTNAEQLGGLRLSYVVNDGLVVWINGNEVARDNVSPDTQITINTLAAAPVGPTLFTNVVIPASGVILNGSNTIAVQVFNASLDSADILFDAFLDIFEAETIPPTIVAVDPPPGPVDSLKQIKVTFSEPVVGVTADDLLIDTQPADSVTGDGTTYVFKFAQPPYGGVGISWFPGHGIVDLALPPNAFDGTGPGEIWGYDFIDDVPPTVATLFPQPGATVRALAQIEVTFSEEVSGVDAADLLVNNQPAASVSRAPGGPYVFQFPAAGAGTANFRWATASGITDQAVPANTFGGGSWSYFVDPSGTVGNIVINEVLVSNQEGLADEDGEAQDWIELFNRGSTSLNLAGWSLSDDQETPGLWVFPSVTLGAGQYLVVFASGKDRKTPVLGGRMHTNFKLGTKEFLGLFNSDSPRVLVSGFSPKYPEQRNDYSYGFDSQGSLRYFATPTPGGPNGASTINGVTAPVHFSTTRGHFTQPFTLTLTCATPGATIRYTTNGAEPTLFNSQVHSAPLPVAGTLVLRAAAFRTNLLPSVVSTHSYFFNQNAAVRSLPVLSIVTATSNLFGRSGVIGMGGGSRAGDGLFITNNPATDYHNPSAHGVAWERPVSAEWIRPEDNSGFQIDCGIRVQGSDWQRPRTLPTSKFSFRLYFRGAYGLGNLSYPAFPDTTVPSFNQMVLRAGYNENGNPFIRDEMCRRLFVDMGNVGSVGTFVQLFTNGFYAGYYNPCERIHEEFAQSHHGGSNQWDVVGPDFALSSEGLGVVDGDRNNFNSLHNYIAGQTAASIVDPAVYTEIGRRLELRNFVDYCLVNVFAAMGDWPANNWRAARDRAPGSIWRFYVWDAEWGLGYSGRGFTRDTFAEAGPGPGDSGLSSTSNSEIARMYQSLRRNPEFRLLWADRIQKHLFNGGALTELAVTNRLIAMRNELSTVFTMTMGELSPFLSNRRTNIFAAFEKYGLFGYSNSLYGVYASSNAPVFNRYGGPVAPGFALSMAAPLGGTIYYTTDGTDPRVPFSGAVAPVASAYSQPLVLLQNTLVKARVLRTTNWSALTEATFTVGALGIPLRLTEIMYNPIGGSPYEFLEVQNIGGAPVDLSGMFFSEGVNFTFNAGTRIAGNARLVLANNADPVAFAARYPGVTVAGYYSGNLNNAGERVTLVDTGGRVVFSVDYRDGHGWPAAADGSGASLELSDPLADLNDPANWHASQTAGGSPGTAGTLPALGAVRLNEVLATNFAAVANGATHPDYVELYNNGATAVNLAGWSLSDDGNPGEFLFAPGTTIAAGGYLLVWCDEATNSTPGLHAGFKLDPDGEGVFLFDAVSNRMDAVTFGHQARDYSLGRIGGAWQLTAPTPNAANVAASVGVATDLVINEWLANPVAGGSDWIELYNQSATLPVPLYGIYIANTSAVHRLDSLSFLGPKEYVQFFADEGTGPAHLSFHLPASGGPIAISGPAGQLVQRLSYGIQLAGVSQGRLPDGTDNIVAFPGTASPGAPNYAGTYTGAVLNEILARNVTAVTNAGRVADFIELYNPGASSFSLSGMSLSVGQNEPGQWGFPVTAAIGPGGYLVVWCDGSRPASSVPGDYNTGRSLAGESGGAYLFNVAGQRVDFVEYGPQVRDQSIGKVGAQWKLLAAPTPGAANAAAAIVGGATGVRLNEWMANPASGPDWIELFNPGTDPVDLGGLRLADDLSSVGTNEFVIPPLSFVGNGGFVQFIADGHPSAGRHHLNFSLDAQGEGLRLYAGNAISAIDTVVFSAQARGVSEGRLPDGAPQVSRFPGTATPGAANYAQTPGLVINEVLTHAQSPLEDAVEIRNTGASAVNVGGWFLSDSQNNFKKFRIPDGAVISGGQFLVLYEGQFNAGAAPFRFDAARGSEIWLSGADASGNLSGYRAAAKAGAALEGVSFGRLSTSLGIDYVALLAHTFGQDNAGSLAQFRTGAGLANAPPRVGPIVLNEILYHAPAGAGADDEYLELYNSSVAAVNLFDPAASANTWKISGGVTYSFPAGITLGAGGFALVASVDPADVIALAAFRARNNVPAAVPVYGPLQGRLSNGGDTVELLRPDTAVAGFVPSVVADRVQYTDSAPWPTGLADGGGASLQRKSPTLYGNEPVNWVAAVPTPGLANSAGPTVPPFISAQPADQRVFEGAAPSLSVSASGGGPLSYQWRFNRVSIPGATNSSFSLSYAVSEDTGLYDVIVSNPAGSSVSSAANVNVVVPPTILSAPGNTIARSGNNVVFSVSARGDAPLTYQWRKNGINLPGENSSTLTRTNVQLADEGVYDLILSNPISTVMISVSLVILVNPIIVQQPISQSVVVGGWVTLSASYTGNPAPFTNEWRKISAPPPGTNVHVASIFQDFYTFTATNVPQTNQYRLVIRNLANATGVGSTVATIITLADRDGDGIPDQWADQYGFTAADRDADPDGDGMSNWQEYIAGTDPMSAASSLRVDFTAVPPTVQFGAISNRTYTIQYSDGLRGPWLRLADVLARSNNHSESIPDPGYTTNRFYRAVTPQLR